MENIDWTFITPALIIVVCVLVILANGLVGAGDDTHNPEP